ncbi:unnamed protein product, partial [Prorocentrum cordatum]
AATLAPRRPPPARGAASRRAGARARGWGGDSPRSPLPREGEGSPGRGRDVSPLGRLPWEGLGGGGDGSSPGRLPWEGMSDAISRCCREELSREDRARRQHQRAAPGGPLPPRRPARGPGAFGRPARGHRAGGPAPGRPGAAPPADAAGAGGEQAHGQQASVPQQLQLRSQRRPATPLPALRLRLRGDGPHRRRGVGHHRPAGPQGAEPAGGVHGRHRRPGAARVLRAACPAARPAARRRRRGGPG